VPAPDGERLQKILAARGVPSRRAAEALIEAGRVTVDDRVATLGERADPERQRIVVDGRLLSGTPPVLTLMLHKPAGVVVSASDEHGRRTVYDLLPSAPPGLRYVGRLDRDSEGLLLLTTDGRLAFRLTHPSYGVDKVYEATVEGEPTPEALGALERGVALDDGRTAPAHARLLGRVRGPAGARRSRVRLVLREGRKRQVRRMLEAVGYPVRRLVRTRVGGLQLGTLPPGAARPLDASELERLRALVGLDGEAREGAEGDADEARVLDGALALGDVDARSDTPISSPRLPDHPRERPLDDRSRPIPPDPDETESLARSIAIDGPTAAGKSVAGRAIAEALGVGFFDTGLMYRACTLAVRHASVDPEDADAVTELVRALDLDMRWPDPATPEILLAGEDVTPLLREPDIEATVSLISRIPEVRDEMVRRQRGLAARSSVVMAGRDIGTRVLVEARAKFFLDASSEVRARRRLGEEREAGRTSSFDNVLSQTRRRDELDQTGQRAIRREQAAPDAMVVDTDALGIDQVVEVCVRAYREANGDGADDARAARTP